MASRGAFRTLFVLGRSWSSMVDFVLNIGLRRLIGLDWPRVEFGTDTLRGTKAYRDR
jgi:hypothetical protein